MLNNLPIESCQLKLKIKNISKINAKSNRYQKYNRVLSISKLRKSWSKFNFFKLSCWDRIN